MFFFFFLAAAGGTPQKRETEKEGNKQRRGERIRESDTKPSQHLINSSSGCFSSTSLSLVHPNSPLALPFPMCLFAPVTHEGYDRIVVMKS